MPGRSWDRGPPRPHLAAAVKHRRVVVYTGGATRCALQLEVGPGDLDPVAVLHGEVPALPGDRGAVGRTCRSRGSPGRARWGGTG